MEKKIIISGNPNYGLASELNKIYPNAIFLSRKNGYDLTSVDGQTKLCESLLDADIFINSAALWKFNQTILLDTVYKFSLLKNKNLKIICVGSTTDRVKKGGYWLYNAEKKALRDYCNSLSINSVWEGGPKVTLISFGSLTNVQHKHLDRTCMEIGKAASYIKWIIDQPLDIHINEISIDPIQKVK